MSELGSSSERVTARSYREVRQAVSGTLAYMTIREFILARLAEDDATATTDRERREIAAKRAMLAHYDSAHYDPTATYSVVGARAVGIHGWQPPPAQIICAVAAIYADHPDFEERWGVIARSDPRP